MKVLIDTNVLLDFYCEREDFFEDMVQYHSARLISADCIVTRNVKDFVTATSISVMTPSQFLAAQ